MKLSLSALTFALSLAPNGAFLHVLPSSLCGPARSSKPGFHEHTFVVFAKKTPRTNNKDSAPSQPPEPPELQPPQQPTNRPLRKQPFQVIVGWEEEDYNAPRPSQPKSNPPNQEPSRPKQRQPFAVKFDQNAFPDQGSRMSTVGRGAAGSSSGSKRPSRTVDERDASSTPTVVPKRNYFAESPEQAEERRRVQDDFWKKPLTAQEAAYYRGLEAQQRQLEAQEKAQLEADLREEARMEALALAARRGQEDARRKAALEAQKREEELRAKQERTYGAAELFRTSKRRETEKNSEAEQRLQELAYQRQAQLDEARARAAARLAEEERQVIAKAKKRGEELIRRRKDLAEGDDSIKENAVVAYQRQVELEKARDERDRLEEVASRILLEEASRRGAEAYKRKIKLEQERAKSASDSALDAAINRGKSFVERQRELEEKQRHEEKRMKELQQLRIARSLQRSASNKRQDDDQISSLEDKMLDAAFRRGEIEAERKAAMAAERKAEEERLHNLQSRRIAEAQQRDVEARKYTERSSMKPNGLMTPEETLLEAARQRGLAQKERTARLEEQRIAQEARLEERRQEFLAAAQERGLRMAQLKADNEEARRAALLVKEQIFAEAQLRGLQMKKQQTAENAGRREEELIRHELESNQPLAAVQRGLDARSYMEPNKDPSYATEQLLATAELRGLELQKQRVENAAKLGLMEQAEKEADSIRLKEAEERGIEILKYNEAKLTEIQAEEHRHLGVLAEAELRGLQLEKKKNEAMAKMKAMEKQAKEAEIGRLKAAEERGLEAKKYKEVHLAQTQHEESRSDSVLAEAEIRGLELEKKKTEARAKIEAMEREVKEAELRRQKEAEERGIAALKYREVKMAELQATERGLDDVLAKAEQRGLELEKKRAVAEAARKMFEDEQAEAEKRLQNAAERRGLDAWTYRLHADEKTLDDLKAQEHILDAAARRGEKSFMQRLQLEAEASEQNFRLQEAKQFRVELAEKRGELTELMKAMSKRKKMMQIESKVSMMDEAIKRGEMAARRRAAEAETKQREALEREEASKRLMADAQKRGHAAAALRAKERAMLEEQSRVKNNVFEEARRRGSLAAKMKAAAESKRIEEDRHSTKVRDDALRLAEERGLRAAGKLDNQGAIGGGSAASLKSSATGPGEEVSWVPPAGFLPDQSTAPGVKHISLAPSTHRSASDMSMDLMDNASVDERSLLVESLSRKIDQLQNELRVLAKVPKVAAVESIVSGSADDVVTADSTSTLEQPEMGQPDDNTAIHQELTKVQDARDEAMLEQAHHEFVSEGSLVSSVTTSVLSTSAIKGTWPQTAWERVEAEKKRRAIAKKAVRRAEDLSAHVHRRDEGCLEANSETDRDHGAGFSPMQPETASRAILTADNDLEGSLSLRLKEAETEKPTLAHMKEQGDLSHFPQEEESDLRETRRLQWAESERRSVEQPSHVDAQDEDDNKIER